MILNKKLDMPARRDNVVKSPKLEAMGVATLSGFIFKRLDRIITSTITIPVYYKFIRVKVLLNPIKSNHAYPYIPRIPRMKLAVDAVQTEDEIRIRALLRLNGSPLWA
jgi:hypothetical protein